MILFGKSFIKAGPEVSKWGEQQGCLPYVYEFQGNPGRRRQQVDQAGVVYGWKENSSVSNVYNYGMIILIHCKLLSQ